MARCDDVKYMTDYLRQAYTFEKLHETWKEAKSCGEAKLVRINQRKEALNGNYNSLEARINSFDVSAKTQFNQLEKNNKKYRNYGLIAICSLLIIFAFMFFRYLPIAGASKAFLTAAFITAGVSFFPILIGIVMLITYKSKKKKLSESNYMGQAANQKNSLINNRENIKEEYQRLLMIEKNTNADLSVINNKLSEIKGILYRFYSSDDLAVKYRNFIAVGTMLDYLITGRCIIIRGDGGIIATYEEDLKHKQVIGELNELKQIGYQVLKNQSVMIQNQERIIDDLNDIGRQVGNIERGMERANEKLDSIDKNTAITAVAATQTAANTSYISSYLYSHA